MLIEVGRPSASSVYHAYNFYSFRADPIDDDVRSSQNNELASSSNAARPPTSRTLLKPDNCGSDSISDEFRCLNAFLEEIRNGFVQVAPCCATPDYLHAVSFNFFSFAWRIVCSTSCMTCSCG